MITNILLANDYIPSSTKIIRRLTQLGYQIITAESGKAAVFLATKNFPNLIICEIELPDMDA
jgi:two-component system cell cycle response regulator